MCIIVLNSLKQLRTEFQFAANKNNLQQALQPSVKNIELSTCIFVGIVSIGFKNTYNYSQLFVFEIIHKVIL